jgi:hypothetical protein
MYIVLVRTSVPSRCAATLQCRLSRRSVGALALTVRERSKIRLHTVLALYRTSAFITKQRLVLSVPTLLLFASLLTLLLAVACTVRFILGTFRISVCVLFLILNSVSLCENDIGVTRIGSLQYNLPHAVGFDNVLRDATTASCVPLLRRTARGGRGSAERCYCANGLRSIFRAATVFLGGSVVLDNDHRVIIRLVGFGRRWCHIVSCA